MSLLFASGWMKSFDLSQSPHEDGGLVREQCISCSKKWQYVGNECYICIYQATLCGFTPVATKVGEG